MMAVVAERRRELTGGPVDGNVDEEEKMGSEDPSVSRGCGLSLSDPTAEKFVAELQGKGNVEELDLSDNILESVPRAVAKLSGLKRLRLDGNRLRKLDEAQLPNGLELLSVRFNALESVKLGQRLSSIVELQLGGNKLQDANLGPGLADLKILGLEGNRLSRVDVSPLRTLEVLDLSDNRIKHVSISGPPLRVLQLARNEIEVFAGDALGDVTARHLEQLDLSCNALVKIEDDAMKRLKNLTSLSLSDNSKLEHLPATLVILESLKHLDVARCDSLVDVNEAVRSQGFDVVRLNMRERLLQQVVQKLFVRLQEVERHCQRLDRLRALKEQESSTDERILREQLDGEKKSRNALESASQALKLALTRERTRTETLLNERAELAKELQTARNSPAAGALGSTTVGAGPERVRELEAALLATHKRLKAAQEDLSRNQALLEKERRRPGPGTSNMNEGVTVESRRLRQELVAKERSLEAERMNVQALEQEIGERQKTASAELERLHERIAQLEGRSTKGSQKTAGHGSAVPLVTPAAELARVRAENEALRNELAACVSRESTALKELNSVKTRMASERQSHDRLTEELSIKLAEVEKENLRWVEVAQEFRLFNGSPTNGCTVELVRNYLVKEFSSRLRDGEMSKPLVDHRPVEPIESRAVNAASSSATELYKQLKELSTSLQEERERSQLMAERTQELSTENVQIKSELAVNVQVARDLQDKLSQMQAESDSELLNVRKELSVVRAEGASKPAENQHLLFARNQQLEASMKDTSAEMERLHEVLSSKERALSLLAAKEQQLRDQVKVYAQEAQQKDAELTEYRKQAESLEVSNTSLGQRLANAESKKAEAERDLMATRRSAQQLAAERDRLVQKQATLEANLARLKEESRRAKEYGAELDRNLERTSQELTRSRQALADAERRSAEQESEIGRRGKQLNRLEAILEEHKNKLLWKDSTLEKLHERVASEKMIAAGRLDEINKLTEKAASLQRDIEVTVESRERAREMVLEIEERLNETIAAKERSHEVAEQASEKAANALSSLEQTSEKLRSAREVATVRETALSEHAEGARERVLDLTKQCENLSWELRSTQESLEAKSTESELRAKAIAELEEKKRELESEVTSWTEATNSCRAELQATKAELGRRSNLLSWKDGEIEGLNKRIGEIEDQYRQTDEQLNKVRESHRQRDAELASATHALRERTASSERVSAELSAKGEQLKKVQEEVAVLQSSVSTLETKLKSAQDSLEAEVFSRQELEVQAKALREKVEILTGKLLSSNGALKRKSELLRSLEASSTEKEGEHTSTLTRLRELEKEFSERGSTIVGLESKIRQANDEHQQAQKALTEKQDECSVLQKQCAELSEVRSKLEACERENAQLSLETQGQAAEITDLSEKLSAKVEETQEKTKTNEELVEKVTAAELECSSLRLQMKDAELALESKGAEADDVHQEHLAAVQSKQVELEAAGIRHSKIETELSESREEVTSLRGDIAALEEKIKRSQESQTETYKQKMEQRTRLEDLQGTISKLNVELNMTKRLLKAAEEELSSANNKLSSEQSKMTTDSTNVKALQDKLNAKEESLSQLQRYSRFVNGKLQEAEKSLAEKQQQMQSALTTVKKLEATVETLSGNLTERERQLRASESAKIEETSGLRSQIRTLEDTLEKARNEVKKLSSWSALDTLQEELATSQKSVRERDDMITKLRSEIDEVVALHNTTKEELFELKDAGIRKDNELHRVRAQLVEMEEDKQSVDSGTKMELHELQRRTEELTLKLQRSEKDAETLAASENKWRDLCEKMKPIVKRCSELEGVAEQLRSDLLRAEEEATEKLDRLKENSERSSQDMQAEIDRQSKLVEHSRQECTRYLAAYKIAKERLEEAIKAGFADAEPPPEFEVETSTSNSVGDQDTQPQKVEAEEEPVEDQVRVKFVLDGGAAYGGAHQFKIVGGDEALGSWSAERGGNTELDEFKRHVCSVQLPRGSVVEYKYVLCRADGGLEWELGNNRTLDLRGDAVTLEVHNKLESSRWH